MKDHSQEKENTRPVYYHHVHIFYNLMVWYGMVCDLNDMLLDFNAML